MRTILCYGDSNVRGSIPLSLDENRTVFPRYPKSKRWTGLLQLQLGDDYEVIQEGIGGRTTNLDEAIPGRPYRNGLKDLAFCLESHYPIDLVIFLLGTNDTKIQFNRSVEQIAEGLRELVTLVKNSNKGLNNTIPKILVLAPQPILEIPNLHPSMNLLSVKKSQQLAKYYQRMAEEESCDFLDAGQVVTSSEIDGLHLDESQSILLATAVAKQIKKIFNE